MLEKHYCAHPLIPGYGPPSTEGIRKWAVQWMYSYCKKKQASGSLGLPLGKLVPKRSMGTKGSFSPQLNSGFEDDNDFGKPVSILIPSKK